MSFHTAARPCAFTCNVWFWSESEALECQTHKSVNGVGCSLYVLHSDRLYVALVFTQCRHRPVSKLNRCPEFHVRVFLHFIQSTSSLMIYSNEKYCSVCKCVLYNLLQIVFLCGSLMLHTPGIARCIMCIIRNDFSPLLPSYNFFVFPLSGRLLYFNVFLHGRKKKRAEHFVMSWMKPKTEQTPAARFSSSSVASLAKLSCFVCDSFFKERGKFKMLSSFWRLKVF